jgi:hypothetical protein
VNAKVAAAVLAVAIVLSLAVAWVFEMPLERAFVLSPVIIAVVGIMLMTLALLTRAAIESARELKNPRRFWVGMAVACVVIAVLSVLGLELPREGA